MSDLVVPSSTNSPVSLSESTAPHLYQAVSTQEMREGVDKVNDVTLKAFERAKASASYGIVAHVYYGVILRLKEKIMGHLNESQGSKLQLYTAHTALCAQIDKVKSAYKAYRTAQKTADNAPLEPAIQRKGARRKAQTAGDKLVEQYDQLIELAVKQAAEIGFSKEKHLNDIQSELSKDTKDYILQTVNQLRARKPIESPVVDPEKHSTSINNNDYINFVTDFVSQVHVANQKSGGCEDHQEISKAFIEGLALIPELGDGLILIDLYDDLNKQADKIQKNQLQGVVDSFSKQLEGLMKKEGDITDEELNSIYSHGVALSSVLDLTADELNKLKNAREERLRAESFLDKNQAELVENQKVIDGKTNYSLNDIKAFLQEIGKKLEDLPAEAKKEGTAAGRLEKEINDIHKQIEALTKQLEKIKTDSETQKQENARAVKQCELGIKHIGETISTLDESISYQTKEIAKLEAEAQALTNAYLVEKAERLAKTETSRLGKRRDESLERDYFVETTAITEQIASHQKIVEETKREKEAQQKILDQEIQKLPGLVAKTEEDAKKALKTIAGIKEEIIAKQIDPMTSLSGAEVAEIGRGLKVGDLSSKVSKIAVTYLKVITAIEKVRKLTVEKIPAHKKNIESQSEILKDDSLMVLKKQETFVVSDRISMGADEVFVVNSNYFKDKTIQQNIETQLASNLGIAKGVTLAVAEKVIERDNAFFTADFEARKAKMSVFDRQAFNRPGHPLQPELDKRKSDHSVFDEIKKRVKVLPATVNPAPVSVAGDEVILDVGDDADASSAGDEEGKDDILLIDGELGLDDGS